MIRNFWFFVDLFNEEVEEVISGRNYFDYRDANRTTSDALPKAGVGTLTRRMREALSLSSTASFPLQASSKRSLYQAKIERLHNNLRRANTFIYTKRRPGLGTVHGTQ